MKKFISILSLGIAVLTLVFAVQTPVFAGIPATPTQIKVGVEPPTMQEDFTYPKPTATPTQQPILQPVIDFFAKSLQNLCGPKFAAAESGNKAALVVEHV